MLRQIDLFEVHQHEPSQETQKILDHNREVFSKDCKRVYEYLMGGGRASVKEMDVDRSRLSDLKRLGFFFSFELKEGRYKVWYASEADKDRNRGNMKLILEGYK